MPAQAALEAAGRPQKWRGRSHQWCGAPAGLATEPTTWRRDPPRT